MLIRVLNNDNDPDGDKLKIISVSFILSRGGIVTVNENGTVTYLPEAELTYTISDSKGIQIMRKCTLVLKQVQMTTKTRQTKSIQ